MRDHSAFVFLIDRDVRYVDHFGRNADESQVARKMVSEFSLTLPKARVAAALRSKRNATERPMGTGARQPHTVATKEGRSMLTDIFAARYAVVPIWENYGESERRLLVQSFRIVHDQVHPYWTHDGKEREGAKATWTGIHDRLTMELGLNELSVRGHFRRVNMFGNEQNIWESLPIPSVCRNFVCAQYAAGMTADCFMKDRLSFIEIAFRDREAAIDQLNAELPAKIAQAERDSLLPPRRNHTVIRGSGNPADGIRAWNRRQNEAFQNAAAELNERFRQAGVRLHYHNGFIQISDDEQIQRQVETPFWALVKDVKWKNVDIDIKEAIDRRDSAGRDPGFYAAKALESAIKIISGEKGWTHGGERGAHSYIDNLASVRNGAFIARWEQTALKGFFSDVRNELGHGPGGEPMPELTPQQADWAIEVCMSWIKSLIKRM